MLSHEIRAADYRAKAHQARMSADGSALLQVRRKHEESESVWLKLAALEDRRGVSARQMIAGAAAGPRRKQALELSEPL